MGDRRSLNAPRWEGSGPWSEAWFITCADPRRGIGLWLRYALDVDPGGGLAPSMWASFMDGARAFALRNVYPAAAFSRTDPVAIGAGELSQSGCSGVVEAGGRSLRWRLSFDPGAEAEDVVPAPLRPIAALRGSGMALPHPSMRVSGALEVDGRPTDLDGAPGAQGHLWARERWLTYTWARCNAFAEDPSASVDLTALRLPVGVQVPLYTFRSGGEVHRFQDPPWVVLSRSSPAAPTWHFSAADARVAIDGVVRGRPASSVLVSYPDSRGKDHPCSNTELAEMELRVRVRAFPGARWRPHATLTSAAACLEFCGQGAEQDLANRLVTGPADEEGASGRGRTAADPASGPPRVAPGA
jgi:hypothetical protein